MTQENLEKATELKKLIDTIKGIRNILSNPGTVSIIVPTDNKLKTAFKVAVESRLKDLEEKFSKL